MTALIINPGSKMAGYPFGARPGESSPSLLPGREESR